MNTTWQILTGNLAIVALVISVWAHIYFRFRQLSDLHTKLAFGAVMGAGTMASMMMSVPLSNGVFIDLRYSLVAISALFGGAPSAILTIPMAVAFRLYMGGAGAVDGVISIACAGAVSLTLRILQKRRKAKLSDIFILGATVSLTLLATMLILPNQVSAMTLQLVGIPAIVLNFGAIAVAGSLLLQFENMAQDRDLLTAALTQTPDFQYVKNRDSVFVVVNRNVAEHHHFSSPEAMIGTTDFHIATQRRAEVLFAEEQDLMRRGEAQINKIESLMQGEREHWFRTSKVPLRDRDGVIIGLAGVTRDITEERRIERELRDSRNMLSHAMSGMSDGFAMYDPQGKLVYANPQYSNLFPLSGVVRVAGYNIRDILRKAIETQERRNFPVAVDEQWIETAARDLHRDKDEEIDLYDGRWLSLRTRMTADGMALVVVSDVTAMKQAEHSLRAVADRMKSLAETDGLTGIVNRRAFDEALALALARSVRERTPLSLLMIDVDRFKAYNDTYGHLAGDECLKSVTDCLRKAARRDTDIVARFGGEEFVVLMPEADEADACRVAGQFRDALHALNLPHTGSEFTRVTASVGVAVKQSRGRATTPSEFMQHADEALYDAKRGGRDRVSVWESPSSARAVNG